MGAAMLKRAAHLAIAFVFAFPSCIVAQELSYRSGLKGAAASAVGKYVEGTKVECDQTGKGNETCALGPIAVWSKILYGKMQDDLADYAVAFVNYEPPGGGNSQRQMAIVFKAVPGGPFAALGRVSDFVGWDPRDARFERGAIAYTATVLGPRDPRCCPTAKATFRLLVSSDGVKFVDSRDDGAGAPRARSKSVDWLIREQIADACDGKPGKINPAAVIERDLTGDGKADLIISHDGISCNGGGRSSACGMQVCAVKIYVRDGALLKLAVGDLLGTAVKVGDGAVPTIEWRIHGGGGRVMKWNGQAFR